MLSRVNPDLGLMTVAVRERDVTSQPKSLHRPNSMFALILRVRLEFKAGRSLQTQLTDAEPSAYIT